MFCLGCHKVDGFQPTHGRTLFTGCECRFLAIRSHQYNTAARLIRTRVRRHDRHFHHQSRKIGIGVGRRHEHQTLLGSIQTVNENTFRNAIVLGLHASCQLFLFLLFLFEMRISLACFLGCHFLLLVISDLINGGIILFATLPPLFGRRNNRTRRRSHTFSHRLCRSNRYTITFEKVDRCLQFDRVLANSFYGRPSVRRIYKSSFEEGSKLGCFQFVFFLVFFISFRLFLLSLACNALSFHLGQFRTFSLFFLSRLGRTFFFDHTGFRLSCDNRPQGHIFIVDVFIFADVIIEVGAELGSVKWSRSSGLVVVVALLGRRNNQAEACARCAIIVSHIQQSNSS
mmetsp:Transcript_4315/g.8241  ORF Transcript_4315/g.8241 Transcript_4315/m.8241 type:complete len:342 (-) Transcript_4315:198-1223(-)